MGLKVAGLKRENWRFVIGAQARKRGPIMMKDPVQSRPKYGAEGIVSTFFWVDLISFPETTNVVGNSFVDLPEPLTDPEFLAEAQQAIKQLQESPLFKGAGLTELEPQWILSLSIG